LYVACLAFLFIAAGLPVVTQADDALSQNESTELAARTAAYFDPDRAGEGIFVEMLPGGRVLIYLFSYGPKYVWGTDPLVVHEPRQTWMIATGTITAGGIVADGLQPVGGHFGVGFDPDEIAYQDFGTFLFSFPTCGSSTERGSFEVWAVGALLDFQDLAIDNYVQLSQVLDCETGQGSPNSHRTGSWFDPSRAGEGFIVQVLRNGRAVVQWMTYDNDGGQMWMQGIGEFDDSGRVLSVAELQTFIGTYWGSDFDPAEVTARPFGSLTMEFSDCEHAFLSYDSLEFGSGTQNLQRLTTPIGINDSGIGCWDY